MSGGVDHIPVIDISFYGLGVEDVNCVSKDQLQGVADKICGAFSGIGFCYISDHGIPESLIEEVMTYSKIFFEQSDDIKARYARPANKNHGWLALEREQLTTERPRDLKEAYDYAACEDTGNWPDFPKLFETSMKTFYNQCLALTSRLLDLLSIGLKLPDRNFLRDRHALLGKVGNPSNSRSLFYPGETNGTDIKSGQIRCGEHTDYGSITLLFQDSAGGLEVKIQNGEFIPVKPIPGTILINIGDLMQRWTADRLKATNHRVVFPNEEERNGQPRQSVVFFVRPDDDVIISCLDNSNKYLPVRSKDYLSQKYRSTITGVS